MILEVFRSTSRLQGIVVTANANHKRSRSFSNSSSSLFLRTATTCLIASATSSIFGCVSTSTVSAFATHGGSLRSRNRYSDRNNVSSHRLAVAPATSFTTHSSLSELLQEFDYDALILDQFGVLHNGKNALEGTIDCVRAIGEKQHPENSLTDSTDAPQDKPKKKLQLIVLSNTSSPSKTTLDRLESKLGFDRSYFCGAVTSGEEAARHIRETYGQKVSNDADSSDTPPKSKFVWCTWDPSNENVPDPSAFLELCGPNVEPTVDVDTADFVVAHGSGAIWGFNENKKMDICSMGSFLDDGDLGEGTPISDLLQSCAKRNLPLVCANPDFVVQYHDGSLKHMPGKIAERYRELLIEQTNDSEGANRLVTIYGKPHPEHFIACLRTLEEDRTRKNGLEDPVAPLRVAHVGDSLHHDIAGANKAGIPSIFIVGGIHAEELLSDEEDEIYSASEKQQKPRRRMPSETKLQELFEREGITPTHVLPVFNY